MATRIINVANRLPVTVGEEIRKSSGGLVAALEGLPREQYTLEWLGWPGGVVEEGRRPEVEKVLRQQYGATPVYLSEEEEDGFYSGFSNSSLWPLLHYMANRMHYEHQWWELYRQVNERFAQRVLEIARDGDLVWVHDYQLMLLPEMLKQQRPGLRIGFFLHTPFPSYEVFRVHPRREELLRGMLGADQIGFHTPGYLRHFRSAVIRIAGLTPEISSVRVGGRTSYFGTYPIGIHAAKFEQELNSSTHPQKVQEIRDRHPGKRLVVSVERMDYTKGILHRLQAIDEFLKSYPERNTVAFVFVSVPSRGDVPEYQELREQVESQVGRLNGKYTTLEGTPIHFIHGSVQFPDLCALYAAADVGLVTPLMDGMNLVAKEYVACQKEGRGVLILSEFAGAVEELFSAVIVNPYDVKAVADSIAEALAMDERERVARMEPIRKRVMSCDSPWWAKTFVQDLLGRDIRCTQRREIAEAQQKLRSAVQAGERLALFLDYDGTLRELVRDPAAATPTPAIRRLLDLLQDQRSRGIDTTIISGRKHEDLERFVGAYEFGLIAEHGADVRRPGQRTWEQLDQNISYGWKPEVAKVLQHYTDSTPGSWIEQKRSSLVWHYRMVEAEFGQWRSKELVSELTTLTQNEQVQVRHGNKIVEIAAAQISKGEAVRQLIDSGRYDLILCAGDDQTDESMFALAVPNMLKIKIGAGDTRADYGVQTPAEFRDFLERAIGG